MEIRVLNYFLTVAREGNITRAAKLLHITQPTLSRQLMQLEDELGTALFIRGKRQMTLTEDGQILKRRAEEIITLSTKAEMEIGKHNREIDGEITIACGMTEAALMMGEMIRKFKTKYPLVTFHIRNGNSDFVVENIDHGLIDIGVVLEPVHLEKLNSLRLPKLERWGLLMRKDSPLAKKEHITKEDLIDVPLIHSVRQLNQDYLKEWFGEGYEKLKISATAELTFLAAILVENNLGYALVIEGATESVGEHLCFRPLFPDLTTHSLVVWKKYQSYNLTVSRFLDFIIDEIK